MTDAREEGGQAREIKDWMIQIDDAKKRDKNWRKESEKYYDRYDNEKAKDEQSGMMEGPGEGAFNLLFSNTQILQPALYSSTPRADVRRRFRDKDPLGKLAATALERSLDYSISAYAFDDELEDSVFDMLICGRGTTRVRYKPTIETEQVRAEDGSVHEFDRVTDEAAECETVEWNKWLILGKAKRWSQVPAIAFEHSMSREDLIEHFGEDLGNQVKLDDPDDEEGGDGPDENVEREKTALVWEIWDKDTLRVLFFAPSFTKQYLSMEDDPMKLRGFWPMPRPMYIVPTTKSLVPVPLTRLYRRQLKELDFLTVRIAKVVDAMRVRGLYPGNLSELGAAIMADDNDFVPVENLAGIMSQPGGLEKAIWLWPIEKLPGVLQQLYVARDQVKQSIYEIIGISDILRGATKASETLGAQKIKAQSGSLRISKAQREVQRFVRGLLRLKAEIMVDKFDLKTIATVTNMKLVTPEQKQQAQLIVAQAQQQGLPQPPPQAAAVLQKPSWDDVLKLLKDDKLRTYKVDIETDSTVSDQLDRDMEGLTQALTGMGQVMNGSAQAVQAGILSPDTVLDIVLTIARRARMGSEIEDSIEEHRGEGVPMLKQLGEQMQQIAKQVMTLTQIVQGAAQPQPGGPPAQQPGGQT